MNESPAAEDGNEEVSALVETLHESGRCPEEPTGGEVDTVADRGGRTFALRRAQDRLHHSEAARQLVILNALPAHIALLDTQGVIISVNEAWRRLACANAIQGPGHEIGVNYLEICDSARGDGSADAHQVAEGIRSVLGGGLKSFSIKYPCDRPTEQRWFLLTVTPLADGHPGGAVVMHLDVTAERQAEESLRVSDSRFRQMAESIRDVFFLQDLDSSHIHYVSPAYERIWGRTCESLYANPASWADSIHPDDLDHAFTKFKEGRNTGFDCEFRIVRPDGEMRWIHVRGFPILDHAGNPYRTTGVASDITERKRADEALRESGSRLSAVFHASPIGISVSRVADGRILDLNDAALRLYGYPRDELVGRSVIELGVYADQAQRTELLAQLDEQGQVERFEIDFCNSSGVVGKLELTGRVIELQGEQCLVAMMVDVTERKRLEEVHLQAQKLESLGMLAGGIAHDFNNILAAIRGNADLAARDVGPDHVGSESLGEIRKASARASELVRRIMAFGRPRETQHQVVDLGAVVDEVLKLLRSTLPAGISLTKDFANDTSHVLADAGQIHEAIVNLTTNAVYAIESRIGSIEYRLEPVQVGEKLARSIPGIKEGRYARLTVTDSGRGMDTATLERVFDAFYTTKPVGEGTGLGLSMVHGTMRSHGGAVTVESAPGKGSSFALYFPATDGNARNEEQGAPAQSLLSAGQRVLYVDDEQALVFLANRVLSRLGHRISSFTDPEEALKAFRAHPQDFDIVVTDLSMPHMSGLDLAREVLAVRPGMPVLMTTGYIRAEDEGNARAAGVRELILKPVTMDELSRVLDRLLRDASSTENA